MFTNRIYVAYYDETIVSVIDCETDQVINAIEVGGRCKDIASAGRYVFVGNVDTDTVSQIDTDTDTVVRVYEFPSGSDPVSIACGPVADPWGCPNKIYVGTESNEQDRVYVIEPYPDTGGIIEVVDVWKMGSIGLIVNEDYNKLYIAGGGNRIEVLDNALGVLVDPILVPEYNWAHIATDSKMNRVFVSSWESNAIRIIDSSTDKVINTIKGIKNPRGLCVHRNMLLVAEWENKVYAINANTFERMWKVLIPSGHSGLEDVAFCNQLHKIYAAQMADDHITVIELDPYVEISVDAEKYEPGETIEVTYIIMNPTPRVFEDVTLTCEIQWPTDENRRYDNYMEISETQYDLAPKGTYVINEYYEIPDTVFIPDGQYVLTATLTYGENEVSDLVRFIISRWWW
jgi:YVTN family beta-propeller protein